MNLKERLKKYKANKRVKGADYDYRKALGEARYEEIKEIVKKEGLKLCTRTHRNNNNENKH